MSQPHNLLNHFYLSRVFKKIKTNLNLWLLDLYKIIISKAHLQAETAQSSLLESYSSKKRDS